MLNLLDSEFPSLSGTSQPQFQNPSQAIWQRAVQQTPVQRPQQHQQHSANTQVLQQHHTNQQHQDLSLQNSDDMFTGSTHLQGALDDYGQGGGAQIHPPRRPQTTNIEDFPPLGRNGTDENDQDPRGIMQNAAYGSFSNANAFSLPQNQPQARHGLPSASGSQTDNTRSSSAVEQNLSPGAFGGLWVNVIIHEL